ncbi:MAG: Fic family protein [Gemmatimonadaceae bacterium]|nr:Fic family protein [Gemmatimonadaceae bacterium]
MSPTLPSSVSNARPHLLAHLASDPTRNAPPRHRRACRYATYLPDLLTTLPLQLDSGLAALVSEAERSLRNLNDEGGHARAPLARLLLRTESIASSKLEGLQASVRDLAQAEASAHWGITPGPIALEVLANIEAMVLAVETTATANRFGEMELLSIHQRLLERTPLRHIADRLRTGQNWIGRNDDTPCGADCVPPPPEDLPRLLVDLFAAINDDGHSPLVQAALVHAQFETIHPFDDGNGRTGRALVHVLLRRRGLAPRFVPPISVVFAGARDQYISALTRFREAGSDGVAHWLEHFATATLRAARLAHDYVHAVRALQDRWRVRVRNQAHVPRSDAAAWALIDLLPAHPMLSAQVATAITERAKSRVYEGLEQLVTAGVLLPLSAGQRNRWWEAEGLLDLIARLEIGESPATEG